jgi:hypothetical protein
VSECVSDTHAASHTVPNYFKYYTSFGVLYHVSITHMKTMHVKVLLPDLKQSIILNYSVT